MTTSATLSPGQIEQMRARHAKAAYTESFDDAVRSCADVPTLLDALEAAQRELRNAVKIAGEAADEWDRAPSGMRAGKILIALSGKCPGYRADIDAIHAVIAQPKDPSS
jgi:hypothetical protein